jgi:hypothetical protein
MMFVRLVYNLHIELTFSPLSSYFNQIRLKIHLLAKGNFIALNILTMKRGG